MTSPKPDDHGWYRVKETVDGRVRHYSTRAYSPSAHTIASGDASDRYGNPLPPKFSPADLKTPSDKATPATTTREANKEATS